MTDGIYTLANDEVYDQLVALLNSIEVNAGTDVPVCVIAFDNRLERVRSEIAARKNVTLLDDRSLFEGWRAFSTQVWETHPTAFTRWQQRGINGVYRLNSNHRYAAFDQAAPFDRFVYLDADTLLLNSPDVFFSALDQHDFVVYDYQHKDPSHIFNVNSSKLFDVFSRDRIQTEIFCAGCFAARRGLFSAEQRDWLITKLADGEAEVLYPNAPNQSVLNYMTLRSGIPVYNLAIHLPTSQQTGNSVTSSHFEMKENVVFDRGTRLTYLHYIGIPAKAFQRLCAGENLAIPYRESFLYYRYLHEPDRRPLLQGTPQPIDRKPNLIKRALHKLFA